MKKILFFAHFLCLLSITTVSQNIFDVDFLGSTQKSLLNAEEDSLKSYKVELKTFEVGAIESIEVKMYKYQDSTFQLQTDNLINANSIVTSNNGSSSDIYQINENVISLNLGTYKVYEIYKVYIRIKGSIGKGELIREVEL